MPFRRRDASPRPGRFDGDLHRYLAGALRGRPARLPEDRHRAAVLAAARGDPAAIDLVVRYNLPLVVEIAAEYGRCGVELADLIQEGSVGLLEAIPAWRPDGGAGFAAYAAYHIRKAVADAVRRRNPRRLVSLPWWALACLRRWPRVEAALARDLGRPPRPAEVARALRSTRRAVGCLLKARQAWLAGRADLDGPAGARAGEALLDRLAAPPADPLADLAAREDGERVLAALLGLGDEPRRREAVVRRYGLDGREPATIAAVAGGLGVSRDTARSLCRSGLRRLRAALGDD